MSLRDDARRIWLAGVNAVDSAGLTASQIHTEKQILHVCDVTIPIDKIRHIEVIGAGKAGTGMARGVERALKNISPHVSVSGWVNVPADCVQDLSTIHLHAARPAGINEPTSNSVLGTSEILRRVSQLGPQDICIVLISGGGSALLCQPVAAISLQQKLQLTRDLAAAGAPIHELNCVRTHLSLVKGGGLARACTAGWMITLIVSDVIGDPLSVIASGPTVPAKTTAADALSVLQQRGIYDSSAAHGKVIRFLAAQAAESTLPASPPSQQCKVINRIVGNIRTAMDAAAVVAREIGYSVIDLGSDHAGNAGDEGRGLFRLLVQIRREHIALRQQGCDGPKRVCVLCGGEPTVRLACLPVDATNGRQPYRKGGRNQELILAAIAEEQNPMAWSGVALLSGGTDGEDGPTDAAGAFADEQLVEQMHLAGMDPEGFLEINNSYPFFEQLDGLLKTGPTHTNVMDLRVGLIEV